MKRNILEKISWKKNNFLTIKKFLFFLNAKIGEKKDILKEIPEQYCRPS